MTITPRRLSAPSLWSQPRASLRTVQASHSAELADAATDAATGHPAQRATILRNTGGTFACFYHPLSTARFLEIAATVSWRGTWTPPHGVTLALSITDGTTTVATTSLVIPSDWRNAPRTLWPSLAGGRLDSMTRYVGHIDGDAVIAAGLSATLPWRFDLTAVCGASVYLEAVEFAELPRYAIDSTETFGDDPLTYQPRGIIGEAMSRTGATLEAAYDLNRRTYHALSLELAAPDVVTSAAYAAIPGAQTASGSTGIAWKVRPRRIKGTPRVLFGVRYKTSTAAGGDVRITTSAGTYTLALPGSTTATDLLTGVGYLADAATDSITWSARISAGTLTLFSYWVVDDPV